MPNPEPTVAEICRQIREMEAKATPTPWKMFGMLLLNDPVGNSDFNDGVLIASFQTTDEAGRPRTFDMAICAYLRNHALALVQAAEEGEKYRTALHELGGLYPHLDEYMTNYGAIHDDDCPEDDTCSCIFKPTNEGMSCLAVALAKWRGDAAYRDRQALADTSGDPA